MQDKEEAREELEEDAGHSKLRIFQMGGILGCLGSAKTNRMK
jgi:hypothetical protein